METLPPNKAAPLAGRPSGRPSGRLVAAVVLLPVAWVLLSGYFTPLLLGLGLGSVALVVWLARRMGLLADDRRLVGLWPCLAYVGWLAVAVVKSNLRVARLILGNVPLQPGVRTLPVTQRGLLARALYANSITLTPGTVSMDATATTVEVHALEQSMLDELATGEMDARVSALEAKL